MISNAYTHISIIYNIHTICINIKTKIYSSVVYKKKRRNNGK